VSPRPGPPAASDGGEPIALPAAEITTSIEHRIAFYETDAMTVVHHANYLHFFERARVAWLQEHDQPYTEYVDQDIHFAVTQAQVDYHRSSRFDDLLRTTTWMEWVRGASLSMAYRVERDGELIASGRTEHAAVSGEGRVRRIPREQRKRMAAISREVLNRSH
jgi:acyl-CoA thioester hydrolase